MTKRALAIGCGGTIGGAWIVATLAALSDRLGIDASEFDVLQGTSAGAEMVTMLSGGVGVDDLVAMQRECAEDRRLRDHLAATPRSFPPLPLPKLLAPTLFGRRSVPPLARAAGIAPTGRGDAGWLQRLAEAFAPAGAGSPVPGPGARMVAFDIDRRERVAFGAPGSPSATTGEALRASWAIPGWMPPVTIGDRRFVDGGAASTASIDLIGPDEADVIYVVAPMASDAGQRVPGWGGVIEDRLLRRPMSAVLRKEIAGVRARGTEVVPILPDRHALAGLGANFMNRRRRSEAFESAMATADYTVRMAFDAAGVRE